MKTFTLTIGIALLAACASDDGAPFGGDSDAGSDTLIGADVQLEQDTLPATGGTVGAPDAGADGAAMGGAIGTGGMGGSGGVVASGGTGGSLVGTGGSAGSGGMGGVMGTGGMGVGMGGATPPPACELQPGKPIAYVACNQTGNSPRVTKQGGIGCAMCANIQAPGCTTARTGQTSQPIYCVKSSCSECCVPKDYACESNTDCCGSICAQGKCR